MATKKKKPAKRPATKRAPAKRPPARRQPETLRLRSIAPSLTATDLQRSIAFYRDVLGFIIGEEWRERGVLMGVEMQAGAVTFMLNQDDFAKGRDRLLALPLAFQRLGIIHYIAQSEDQRRTAPLQQIKRLAHLPTQSQRLLIDDQQVGIEDVGGMPNYRRAHGQCVVDIDVQVQRDIFAVTELDDAGDTNKIDP